MRGQSMLDQPDPLLWLALQTLINVQWLIFNYACCQALVNDNLLTQRSSCIGRLVTCLVTYTTLLAILGMVVLVPLNETSHSANAVAS